MSCIDRAFFATLHFGRVDNRVYLRGKERDIGMYIRETYSTCWRRRVCLSPRRTVQAAVIQSLDNCKHSPRNSFMFRDEARGTTYWFSQNELCARASFFCLSFILCERPSSIISPWTRLCCAHAHSIGNFAASSLGTRHEVVVSFESAFLSGTRTRNNDRGQNGSRPIRINT